jgi:hypothetical protein
MSPPKEEEDESSPIAKTKGDGSSQNMKSDPSKDESNMFSRASQRISSMQVNQQKSH